MKRTWVFQNIGDNTILEVANIPRRDGDIIEVDEAIEPHTFFVMETLAKQGQAVLAPKQKKTQEPEKE